MVQSLYDLGHNGFLVDVSTLENSPKRVAIYLRGKRRNPLRARYITPSIELFGWDNRYCELELWGDTENGGGLSRVSTFNFHGAVERAGSQSMSCEYHVRSATSLSRYAIGSDFYIEEAPLERSEGQFSLHASEPLESVDEGFFGRKLPLLKKNRVYLPQGVGNWREVTP